MRIEAHFESGGFWALRPEWNDLVHRGCCDTVFLTWEWQSTWWKHLGEGDLLLLGFRAENDGRLIGIAPLFYTQTDDGKSILNLNGCRDVSDYLDLLIEVGQEDAVHAMSARNSSLHSLDDLVASELILAKSKILQSARDEKDVGRQANLVARVDFLAPIGRLDNALAGLWIA